MGLEIEVGGKSQKADILSHTEEFKLIILVMRGSMVFKQESNRLYVCLER